MLAVERKNDIDAYIMTMPGHFAKSYCQTAESMACAIYSVGGWYE